MKNKIIILLSLIILNHLVLKSSETACPSGERKEIQGGGEESKPEIQLEQKSNFKIVYLYNEIGSGKFIDVKVKFQDKTYTFDVFEGELKPVTNFDEITLFQMTKGLSRKSPRVEYVINKDGILMDVRGRSPRQNVLGKTLIADKETGGKQFRIK